MVKCSVLFEVRTELLSIILTNLGFEGLIVIIIDSLENRRVGYSIYGLKVFEKYVFQIGNYCVSTDAVGTFCLVRI
jgi:high-affinity nickel permease